MKLADLESVLPPGTEVSTDERATQLADRAAAYVRRLPEVVVSRWLITGLDRDRPSNRGRRAGRGHSRAGHSPQPGRYGIWSTPIRDGPSRLHSTSPTALQIVGAVASPRGIRRAGCARQQRKVRLSLRRRGGRRPRVRALFDTNFFGAVDTIKAVLPACAQGSGHVVNVSSMTGIVTNPPNTTRAPSMPSRRSPKGWPRRSDRWDQGVRSSPAPFRPTT